MTPEADYLVKVLKAQTYPVKRAVLAGSFGWSVRKIKKAAEECRLNGIPIGYSTDNRNGGLFLCRTPIEVRVVMDKIERLAKTLLIERSALKRTLAKMEDDTRGDRELFPKEAA